MGIPRLVDIRSIEAFGSKTESKFNSPRTMSKGIPFAKAGRFEHSYLYNESDSLGVIDATSYGPICPQKTTGSILSLNSSYSLVLGAEGTAIGALAGSLVDAVLNSVGADRQEDCLSINVQTPQNITADAKLPVLIWM